VKAKPLIDDRNYTVVCAGVRHANLTQKAAYDKAYALNREWADLGFCGGRGRKVEVFYRDGTLVYTIHPH
jgi:hypothetical protein